MWKSHPYHSAESVREASLASQASINEDIEQRRRMLDKDGELQRMWNANRIAMSIKFSAPELKHVSWPIQAPLWTRPEPGFLSKEAHHAAENIHHAADHSWHLLENVLHSASQFAEGTFNKAAEVVAAFTHKTADIASYVGEKTVEGATAVGEGSMEVASAVGEKAAAFTHKSVDIAASVGEKTIGAASVAGDKVVELAHVVEHATADAATALGQRTAHARHAASGIAHSVSHKTIQTATHVGHKAVDVATGVVAPAAAEIAHEAKTRLVQLKDEILYSTTKKYVRTLMEIERRRRGIDLDEQYAILNGLRTSSLIRDLGPEFYRQWGQNFTYSFTLLEDTERVWRQIPTNRAMALAHTRRVSFLVKEKHFPIAHVDQTYISKKVEVIDNYMPPMVGAPTL